MTRLNRHRRSPKVPLWDSRGGFVRSHPFTPTPTTYPGFLANVTTGALIRAHKLGYHGIMASLSCCPKSACVAKLIADMNIGIFCSTIECCNKNSNDGWIRVAHVPTPRHNFHNIHSLWEKTYHGTSTDTAADILVHGQILLPGDKRLDGARVRVQTGHIAGNRLFFSSPCLNYSASYASPQQKFGCITRVCLELRQKPGTFWRRPQTVGAVTELSKDFSNFELELSTDNRAAVIVTALLFKVSQHEMKGKCNRLPRL